MDSRNVKLAFLLYVFNKIYYLINTVSLYYQHVHSFKVHNFSPCTTRYIIRKNKNVLAIST